MIPIERAKIPQIYQQALAHQQRSELDKAEDGYRLILTIDPTIAEAQYRLAQIALTRGKGADGLPHLQAALAAKPGEKVLWQFAVELYSAIGDSDRVLDAYDHLIAMEPKEIKPKAEKALYLQSIGEFAVAERQFRKLLKQYPYEGELYRILLGGKTVAEGDPLVAGMIKALKHPRQSELGKMHLGYAMAKAMEDAGKTDKVFGYLNLANGIQRKVYPPDMPGIEQERRAVLAAQSDGPLRQIPVGGTPTPIFVTGMPRSGTTLVEQILGAHSAVDPAGELGYALRLAFGRFGAGVAMRKMSQIKDEELAAFADDYRARLRGATRADALKVTDKSIKSELVFGLVHAAMPDARIIVVHRGPRDIALSIYKNYFQDGKHRYANDLGDIAASIYGFQQSVAFWKQRLPGVIHEVQYEALVADPEPQARALLAAAGLEWEDACLDFHLKKGMVKTLSLHQVRQPIHAGRKEAWRKFEADLKPFTDAWEALTG